MNMEWYKSRLSNSKLAEDNIINAGYIQELLTNKDHWRLWKVAVMEAWYREWI
jgi:hypothetical protein